MTMQLGQTQDALDFYQKSMAIRTRLADADPKNVQAQRNLSVSYERLGNVTQRLDQTTQARDYYRKAVEICLRLAEADPKNAQAQRDLGVSYTCLGDLRGGRERPPRPLTSTRTSWRSASGWPRRTRRTPRSKMT